MLYEFKNIKRILVIKLRNIGDVLLTIPAFRAIRETYPAAHITALVNSGTEEVLTGNPMINEIITFDRNIKTKNTIQKYLLEISFLRKIRNKQIDMAIDLTSGDRAALISFGSRAKYRIAHNPGNNCFVGKKYLYTHLAKKDNSKHMVLYNLDIVRQFGMDVDNLSIELNIQEEAKLFVKNIFKAHGINERDKVVHIHPTSRWFFKCWKDEHMAEIIIWLIKMGMKVIVTSSPDYREIEKSNRILSIAEKQIKQSASRAINLSGKTNIKQLAAISAASDLFVGVDSAPMHIAAAVGTQVIALFGPSGAFNWGPWDNNYSKNHPYSNKCGVQHSGNNSVIQKDWECIPCGQDGCDGTKVSKCLDDITVNEIKDIINKKLKEIS